jgi:chorismate mutase
MIESLDLQLIAARLEGLEETIIAKFIDRAQYRVNESVYLAGSSSFEASPEQDSLLDLRLKKQEELDAQFGRYRQPEERPFTQEGLVAPKRRVTIPDRGLRTADYDLVNQTAAIKASYLELVPELCPEGDDGQHGSSVVADVHILQAISERIHYGAMFVAEAKYQGDPIGYRQLIQARDEAGLLAKLTRPEVEERIILRVREKVASAQQGVNPKVRNLIDPNLVVKYYRQHIIPLTKAGEIQYLMSRPPE